MTSNFIVSLCWVRSMFGGPKIFCIDLLPLYVPIKCVPDQLVLPLIWLVLMTYYCSVLFWILVVCFVHLETFYISFLFTDSNLEGEKCRKCVMVYHMNLPLHNCHFDKYHITQFFIICLVPQNLVSHFASHICYPSRYIIINCQKFTHSMRSNIHVIILSVSDRYILTIYPCTTVHMLVPISDVTGNFLNVLSHHLIGFQGESNWSATHYWIGYYW